jgi:hypothetical protein
MKLELSIPQINTIFVALQRNQELIAQTMEEIQRQGQEQAPKPQEDGHVVVPA